MNADQTPPLMERIEALCMENGITVTTLCTVLHISRASISDYKMGRSRSLSTDTIVKIAEHFGTTTDYLLRGIPTEPSRMHPSLKAIVDEIAPYNIYIIPEKDQAMTPYLSPGDRVLIKPVTNDDAAVLSSLLQDTLVLVQNGEKLSIRAAAVFRNPIDMENPSVILRPWNPRYPIEACTVTDIRGIVYGWFSKPQGQTVMTQTEHL